MSRPLAAANAAYRHMSRTAGPFALSATLRPLSTRKQSTCLSASVQVDVCVHGPGHIQGRVRLQLQQMQLHCRWLSTSPRRHDGSQRHGSSGQQQPPPPPPPPPPRGRVPIFRLLLQALGGSLRSLFMPFQGATLRTLYRSNPEELVLALAVLVASAFVIAYVARIYFSYFNSKQFTRYPPEVAKCLRRALYFSNYAPDPKRALKNYRQALEACDELGLDPFSDDVLGIRIQLASWLERIQSYDASIKILELLLADCRRWVDLMEKDEKDGKAGQATAGTLSPRLPPPLLTGKSAKEAEDSGVDMTAATETVWGRRSRILRKAIGVSVKLGELYADEHVLLADKAHERLVWAVDAALQEFQRRATAGTKDGEGEWMSPVEMGAALESLGHSYESRSQFHLALPLFFQALRVCSDPCHSAVIMNNLAVSFAQHPVQPPYETLVGSVVETPAVGKEITQQEAQRAYYETAQRWATNAHQHATDTSGDARTPECDEACVVALCNLGDIAALLGDAREATKRFSEAKAMSEAVAFAPGVQQAAAGLARLQSRPA
ncbi:hypothetical protein HMPREF1624_04564 [Sporothrix schenckii ATCC 58251]|uniref:TPR domain-containing protein n=1 Tax=Sporothrix schenckii (strain ATCC 58251 / de Perez 2211183) TaxID=1391915 RepID=U7PX92_SPOS1|nr:hypothetical protein HMPREF1624_04564 [Sporothrix schenckii ATCC 58251]